MRLKIYFLPLAITYFCVSSSHCQTYVFPFIGGNYSSIEWTQKYLTKLIDTAYTSRLIFGIGIEQSVGQEYSFVLTTTIYNRSSEIMGIGINPHLNTKFRIWDSDISLQRKFGNSFYVGAGFKHQLFHRFYTTTLVGGEKKGKLALGALGYNLHLGYELENFGAKLMFSNIYNYDSDELFITFHTSQIFELVGYYKFLAAGRGKVLN